MITVKILASGELVTCDALWALRLIEQGKAVPARQARRRRKEDCDGTDRQDPE